MTDAILSENYHTGIYYYSTCFVCADISWQSELLLPQMVCRVTEGFFVFCLVLVLLWSNEARRRNKQNTKEKLAVSESHIALIWHVPHVYLIATIIAMWLLNNIPIWLNAVAQASTTSGMV